MNAVGLRMVTCCVIRRSSAYPSQYSLPTYFVLLSSNQVCYNLQDAQQHLPKKPIQARTYPYASANPHKMRASLPYKCLRGRCPHAYGITDACIRSFMHSSSQISKPNARAFFVVGAKAPLCNGHGLLGMTHSPETS